MKIDEFTLLADFTKYNEEYFGGVLPYPKFKIGHGYFTLGHFTCQLDEYNEPYDQQIEISDRYDYTESQLRDVMVHEMVHYYLVLTKEDLHANHGKAFKRKAMELNENYGLNITQRINTQNYVSKPSFSMGYLMSKVI